MLWVQFKEPPFVCIQFLKFGKDRLRHQCFCSLSFRQAIHVNIPSFSVLFLTNCSCVRLSWNAGDDNLTLISNLVLFDIWFDLDIRYILCKISEVCIASCEFTYGYMIYFHAFICGLMNQNFASQSQSCEITGQNLGSKPFSCMCSHCTVNDFSTRQYFSSRRLTSDQKHENFQHTWYIKSHYDFFIFFTNITYANMTGSRYLWIIREKSSKQALLIKKWRAKVFWTSRDVLLHEWL